MADRNDRWDTLLRLTRLLAQGKAVLEDLVGSQVIENPSFLAALDRGFLKKRKRSPRNLKPRFKKPIQIPETSSGGECDQSPRSTLCSDQFSEKPHQEKKRRRLVVNFKKPPNFRNPNFENPISAFPANSDDGGVCDQSPRSTLCTTQFSEKPRTGHHLVNFKKPPNFRSPNFENPTSAFPANSDGGGECEQSPRCANPFSENKGRLLVNFKKPILGPNGTLFRVPYFEKPISANSESRKRKRCSFEFGESSSEEQRLFMDRHIINNTQSLRSMTSLPEAAAIRSRIIETGGRLEGAVCVIEKDLFPSDVDPKKSRLSVPLRQVRDMFLFRDEVELLLAHSDGGIRTTLIQPLCLEECDITFALWGSNTTYVLKHGWSEVCKKNTLRAGMHIRLWAFRRNSDLCFALEV